MPQGTFKPKKKIDKKKPKAANRHGKTPVTKKGNPLQAPKKARLKAAFNENVMITKMVNKKNESEFSGRAAEKGEKLSLLKAPPVLSTKEKKARSKKGKLSEEYVKKHDADDML